MPQKPENTMPFKRNCRIEASGEVTLPSYFSDRTDRSQKDHRATAMFNKNDSHSIPSGGFGSSMTWPRIIRLMYISQITTVINYCIFSRQFDEQYTTNTYITFHDFTFVKMKCNPYGLSMTTM